MSQAGYEKKIFIKDLATSAASKIELPTTTAALSHGGDLLDDTDMKNSAGNRTRIYGLRDWSISMTFNYDAADTGVTLLRNAWLNRTLLLAQYLPDGTVPNGFEGNARVETFNMSGEVGGLEQVESNMLAAGTLGAAT